MRTDRTSILKSGTDWSLNREIWDRDQIIEQYFPYAELRVISRYRYAVMERGAATWDDLKGAAIDGLIKASDAWHPWCAKTGHDPADKRELFYFVNNSVDWRVNDYLNHYAFTDNSFDDLTDEASDRPIDADLLRTTLHLRQEPSRLLAQIAEFIGTLRLREQLVLALRYFDEMPVTTIATMSGVQLVSISAILASTSKKVLAFALAELVTFPEPVPISNTRGYAVPPIIANWINAHYGVELDAYLKFARLCYSIDVSYVVEIIDRAHGIFTIPPTAVNSKVTSEQLADMERRRAAGESYNAIAAVHGLSPQTIANQLKAPARDSRFVYRTESA